MQPGIDVVDRCLSQVVAVREIETRLQANLFGLTERLAQSAEDDQEHFAKVIRQASLQDSPDLTASG